MSDSFSWKGLFVNNEDDNKNQNQESENTNQEPVKSAPTNSGNAFPSPSQQTPSVQSTPVANTGNVNQNVLESVLEMYERGFDSLNQPGYDFYEFFKAIMAINPDNDQAYTMAYTMASSMDKSLNKAGLLTKAQFYVEEIQKVHSKYEAQGSGKKSDILSSQEKEKESLTIQVANLEKQLANLQKELDTKSQQLGQVDSKFANKVIEIDQKLMANNVAKDTILSTINKVVKGIEKNIQ